MPSISVEERRAYVDAVQWVEAFIRPITGTAPPKTPAIWTSEGPARLARIERLLALLGDPQQRFTALHVTGTSGKGSVCTFLGAVLRAAGYRVGVHTTPYLQEPVEKLQIDGRYAGPRAFAALVQAFRAAVAPAPAALDALPYPALWVALTYLFFVQERVDLAVIEASAGGRYDWTNTLQPAVSVITTVGPDHLATLGPALADIAYHKAGVIKAGVPAVTGVEPPERRVLEHEAAHRGSPLARLGDEFRLDVRECTERGTVFDYVSAARTYKRLETAMLGRYQAFNAALAVAALVAFDDGLGRVDEAALREGLRLARLPGRMELIQRDPDVLLDGAHNPQKAAALAASLAEIFPGRPLVLVAGALTTKDASAILAPFAGRTRLAIVTAPHVLGKTAADPALMASTAAALGVEARAEPEPAAALRLALALARRGDLICVTGSLYLVGEVRRLWIADEAVLATGLSVPGAAASAPGQSR